MTAAAAVWTLTGSSTAVSQSVITRDGDDVEAQTTELIGNITADFLNSFKNSSSLSPVSSNCTSRNLVLRRE